MSKSPVFFVLKICFIKAVSYETKGDTMTRAQAESLYPYNVIVEGMANQGSSPQAILEYIKLMGLDFLGGMNRALELMECYGVNTSELRKLSEARV